MQPQIVPGAQKDMVHRIATEIANGAAALMESAKIKIRLVQVRFFEETRTTYSTKNDITVLHVLILYLIYLYLLRNTCFSLTGSFLVTNM